MYFVNDIFKNGYRGRRRSLIADAQFEKQIKTEELQEQLDQHKSKLTESDKIAKLLENLNEEGIKFITDDTNEKTFNLAIIFMCKGKFSFVSDVLKSFEVSSLGTNLNLIFLRLVTI